MVHSQTMLHSRIVILGLFILKSCSILGVPFLAKLMLIMMWASPPECHTRRAILNVLIPELSILVLSIFGLKSPFSECHSRLELILK